MHDHNHHTSEIKTKRLFTTMTLNFVITITEIIGGLISGSISLLSDALHNFTDGISIIISYIAIRLRESEHTPEHTFGLKRAEILAAVINSTILLLSAGYLFYRAIKRFFTPQAINSSTMLIIASIGLIANVIGTLLLKKDAQDSANIRSSYLHLLVDSFSSLGVIIGAVLISLFGITWVDSVLVLIIGIYIFIESYKILSDSIHILMEGMPSEIDPAEVKSKVEKIPEVVNIHHVHIWQVGEKDIFMEAHVDIEDKLVSETDPLLKKIEETLDKHFNINHITIQFECQSCADQNLIKNHGN